MSAFFSNIENEIKNMTKGQKKFYQFDSQEDIDQVFKFLCNIKLDTGINVKPHRESQTGNKNIDVIIVTKL